MVNAQLWSEDLTLTGLVVTIDHLIGGVDEGLFDHCIRHLGKPYTVDSNYVGTEMTLEVLSRDQTREGIIRVWHIPHIQRSFRRTNADEVQKSPHHGRFQSRTEPRHLTAHLVNPLGHRQAAKAGESRI